MRVPGPIWSPNCSRAQGMIDQGDTAWVLLCSALVLLMTAHGVPLFYGGMVRLGELKAAPR